MKHWIMMLPANDTQEDMTKALNKAKGAVGVVKRYRWSELVNANGVSHLTPIISDLNFLKAKGKKLIPGIEDKSFVDRENPMPDKLKAHALDNATEGMTSLRWKTPVVSGMKSTYNAMKNRLDLDYLGGIMIAETSLGLSTPQLHANGYSASGYADMYVDFVEFLANLLPKIPCYWNGNFLKGGQTEIDRVIRECATIPTFRYGTPDCWPTSASLWNAVFPRFKVSASYSVQSFIGISRPSYMQWDDEDERWYTMEEIAAFAINQLKVDELWWTFVQASPRPGSPNFNSAVPIINASAPKGEDE